MERAFSSRYIVLWVAAAALLFLLLQATIAAPALAQEEPPPCDPALEDCGEEPCDPEVEACEGEEPPPCDPPGQASTRSAHCRIIFNPHRQGNPGTSLEHRNPTSLQGNYGQCQKQPEDFQSVLGDREARDFNPNPNNAGEANCRVAGKQQTGAHGYSPVISPPGGHCGQSSGFCGEFSQDIRVCLTIFCDTNPGEDTEAVTGDKASESEGRSDQTNGTAKDKKGKAKDLLKQ